MIVPSVDDAFFGDVGETVGGEYNHKHILRTCFCFGAVSSALVAFLILITSSFSAFSLSTGRVG